jgi:hypothetical protein
MADEESDILVEARRFIEELFTGGIPLKPLMREGKFPEGWVDRYLGFVRRVADYYGEETPVPREVMAVIYTASAYCTKRYADWQRFSGGANEQTERSVNEVRWAGDRFVLRRYWKAEQG